MIVLLPPSETKRDGGADASSLDLAALSYPSLTRPRRTALAATKKLSSNISTASAALKLGQKQKFEVLRNRELTSSPTMPALDRYTGVLYDALDSATLSGEARDFAADHLVIHSALFGLLGAADPIPAYRLSHDSRLPAVRLPALWREPIAAILADYEGLVLDFRSEGYVSFGPAPRAHFLRVVTIGPDGSVRALNHFNKTGKGVLARAIVEAGIDHGSIESLLEWAAAGGIRLASENGRDLQLVVD